METHDQDPRALRLADKHYSRRSPGTKQFAGCGRKFVLLRADESALWCVVEQRDPRGNPVWRNNLFRNEGDALSSTLIVEATALTYEAWLRRWRIPTVPLRTEIDSRKVKSSNPGYCYICAGWERFDGPLSARKRRPYMIYMRPSSRLLDAFGRP